MPQPSFGSGSSLLGGTDALRQAMQSRGIDTSILNQVTPSSGQQPLPTAPTSPSTPNIPSTNINTQAISGVPSDVGMQTNGEAQIILKALTERLKTLSKSGM